MQKINSATSLREAILQLESHQLEEAKMMKTQFQLAYETMKPVNFIKSTIKEISASQDLKDNLLNTGVGLASGYLSKTLFEGSTHNPVKKMLGTVLMFSVTNMVAKHPEAIKALGRGFFNLIQNRPRNTINNTGLNHNSKT